MQYSDIKFTLVRHGNDFVYAFDIPGGRYHGHTRDYNLFNVYDDQLQAFTSYETKPAFTAWLASLGQGNNQTQYQVPTTMTNPPVLKYTGMPQTNVNGFNATPIIILAALGIITWIYLK